MNNKEYKRLEKFVKASNIVKYTLGLPLLLFNTIRFYKRICGAYARLYIKMALEPELIKEAVSDIDRLKKGLSILWEPNKLIVDK